LFHELADPASTVAPVFKLSDWRTIYVDIADPTGYEAAKVLIGNWDHWQALVNNQRFAAELEKWNHEVEVKLRSQAVLQLVKQSRGPQGTTAAKWLAESGFVVRDKRSSRARADEESAIKETKGKVAADAKRLGLHVVGM
jgi:hypothetical protein